MKTSFLYFVMICFAIQFHARAHAQGSQFNVSLKLAKQNYLKAEPIFAKIVIANSGDSDIKWINSVHWLVKDARDNEYPTWSAGIHVSISHHMIDTLTLLPQSADSSYSDLLNSFGVGPLRQTKSTPRYFIESGSYSVQAEYNADGRKVRSNMVRFSVLDPIGLEGRAYDLLVRATKYESTGNRSMAGIVLDTLIKSYASSVYHSLAFIQKFRMYEFSDQEQDQIEGFNAALGLIDANPNSETADIALTYILVRAPKAIKSATQREAFIKRFAQKYPNTIVGKRAQKSLK